MLTFYETQLKGLLQNPAAPTSLYATADLDRWINVARGQVAGESESIRVEGTISTVVGQRNYNFSAINVGTPSATGVQAPIHVRRIAYGVAAGRKWMTPRAWPWFDLFHLSNPIPVNGPPKTWAQYGQGSAGTGSEADPGAGSLGGGSFYVDPPPDAVYTLYCDCVAYPIALAADSDPEALPYLWVDCVPFFAAWYALMSSQNNARMADAGRMMDNYKIFVDRARKAVNPSVGRWMYEQAGDPVQAAKIGLKPPERGAA